MRKEAETDREFMIESNLEQVQAGTEVQKGCVAYSTVSVLTQLNYAAMQL